MIRGTDLFLRDLWPPLFKFVCLCVICRRWFDAHLISYRRGVGYQNSFSGVFDSTKNRAFQHGGLQQNPTATTALVISKGGKCSPRQR